MSGKIVGWAMEQATGSPAAKLVLVKLADNAGEDGLCWPSIELIVEHTELALSTVYKHLARLEEMGLIKSVELAAGTAVATMKGYQLSLPNTSEQIPPHRKRAGGIPPGGKTIPPGGKTIPPGGKTIPPGGILYIEEPSLEPSLEPSGEPSVEAAPVPPPVSQSTFPGFESQPDSFEIPDFLRREAKPDPKPAKPARQPDRTELDAAYDAYNASAERSGWAICQRRSPLRDGHLRRRLKEIGGLEGWKIVLARAEDDDWCCGRVPSRDGRDPFFAHIDYLLREQVITKLMEVQHGDRSRAAPAGAGGVLASASRVAARRAAGGAY